MLIRLYSETDLLVQNIIFVPGINIILGKYSADTKEGRGINGIGKSSLIRLINYLLLSESAEKIFFDEKYDFLRDQKHNIILELKIQDETFFIKRNFDKEDKVFFGINPTNLETYARVELKKILGNKFFPVVNKEVYIEGNRFGTLINFFIKDDLKHQQRIDPLNFLSYSTKAREISIYNFFLLNLPTLNVLNYDELAGEFEKYSKTIKALEEKVKAETGKSLEELKTDRLKIESNINILERSLKDYTFLENYKNIENELIEITGEINEKLKEYHSNNRKLRKIKESYQFSQEVDIKEIQKIFNEVLNNFGNLVSKRIEDVIKFKQEILENRNKFLVNRENHFQKQIDQILQEISELEIKRSKQYKLLEERGALESITNTYEQLIKEKTYLESNLAILKQVDEIQVMLSDLDVSISEVKRDILSDLKNSANTLDELRRLFQEILKNAIFLDEDLSHAYFDVATNTNSKRNQLPFKIELKIPKADALGQSRLNIVAYDIMVFLYNIRNKRAFPDFLVHDGVFHSIAKNTMVNTLNYIYHQHLASPHFQYILTFNEDEIYIPSDKEDLYGKFDFDWRENLIAEFEDTPEKMLFKRAFN